MTLETTLYVPSLKRDVKLLARFTGTLPDGSPGPGLGCHFRWAGNLGLYPTAQWGTEERDATMKYCNSPEYPGLDPKEQDRLFGEIANTVGGIRTQAENSYGPTPAGTPKGPTFIVLSDNINSYTPEFPKNSGIHDPGKIAKGFKTSDFVLWLVKNKCGIIVGSPVGRNHWHQNSENFSLVQAWFWVPPHHAKFTAPGSHFVAGLELQPTWDQWYDDVRKTADGMASRTNEQMDARMWKGGKRNSHLDIFGNSEAV